MSQAPNIDLNALWRYVTDQVKAQVTLPGLWRSMEAAHPLALENDELILGFSVSTSHQKGLLIDSRHRNVIEQVLQAATRKRLAIRLIDGETVEDWETYKLNQTEAQRLQAETRRQLQTKIESGGTWDAVGEQLVRAFAALTNRNLASVQARYLDQAVTTLAEAYGRLMSETPTELEERSYARVLERVSERAGVSSSLIAYFVLRRMGGGPPDEGGLS